MHTFGVHELYAFTQFRLLAGHDTSVHSSYSLIQPYYLVFGESQGSSASWAHLARNVYARSIGVMDNITFEFAPISLRFEGGYLGPLRLMEFQPLMRLRPT
jgi:hypothetical protein